MKFIVVNLIALCLIIAAVYMVLNDKPNWGWFLFFGVIMAGSGQVSVKKNKQQ